MDPDLITAMLTPTGTSTADDPDTNLTLRRALQDLPADQRRPIVLMAFQGLTAQEIATRTDVPLGTVKSRVRRGLARLRSDLGAFHA
jgi:RNA polymerase sigma-70 factor (ECF subfamily)